MELDQRKARISRTLLIDADIIAYKNSAVNERRYDWGDGVTSKVSDLKAAKRGARDAVEALADQLKATDIIICLSDDVENFRDTVYPLYKKNRVSTERPEHLYDIKEWLGQTYQTVIRPRLEADDVMGILSTEPHEGQRIIVSEDKDMQTIPGWLFNPNKDKKPRLIVPEQAERFMLWQALTGDQTDGYPGCPKCGPKTADLILDHDMAWVGTVHTFKSGPRKGLQETRWSLEPDGGVGDVWSRIVSAYTKAGLGEKEALVQVNLARILKHSDMDGKRIIPWTPSMLLERAN